MRKITSIKQQKKDPLRVSVFLDGVFAFGLDSKFLVEFDLYKGLELGDDLVSQIVRRDIGEKIKGRVLALISRRPRSEKEVQDFIFQKFKEGKYEIEELYWNDLIRTIIVELKKYDLINDINFAEWYVRNRKDFKPRGKALLRLELAQKGLSSKIITQVLDYEMDEEMEMGQRLAIKKMRTLSRFSEKDQQKKLISFLQRKGFRWDMIKKIIGKYFQQ